MTHKPENPVVRRAARLLALLPATVVMFATSAAFADAPETWENPPSVSFFELLLVLVLIPGALFLLITLLVYVPSMGRGESYQPGQAWRNEPQWFGGPRGGVNAVDAADRTSITAGSSGDDAGDRGGSSGRW